MYRTEKIKLLLSNENITHITARYIYQEHCHRGNSYANHKKLFANLLSHTPTPTPPPPTPHTHIRNTCSCYYLYDDVYLLNSPTQDTLFYKNKLLLLLLPLYIIIILLLLLHLSQSLITDNTFIQARQAISDEPKASQRYCVCETK